MTNEYFSDAARLTFVETGSGMPVVFLHPTPLDHFYWQPLVQRLRGLRAIVPDLRGHGTSELGTALPIGLFARVPDAPVLTVQQLGRDIFALLDHLHLSQAVFVGCSIGGYVNLELWRQAPDRVRGLAFICSKPQPDVAANHDRRATTIAQVRAGESAAVFDGLAQTLIGSSARALYPAIVEELRARMTLTPEALVAVQAGLAARPDSVPNVATIRVPVFALCGGEDPGISQADMEVFHSAPGGCSFHLLPDAGHFAAYEQPDAVAALLSPWLARF
jgi:pimeloyl-ACP methyl ester carboxylesterase